MNVLEQTGESRATGESSVCALLVELFSRLAEEAIPYCVLRNYEDLPYGVGNDVDLLVPPGRVREFGRCLLAAGGTRGWCLLKNPRRYGYESFWLAGPSAATVLQIDVWTALCWRGIPWTDPERILARRRRCGPFFVPEAVSEAATLLLKDVLQTGLIAPKYREKIFQAAEHEPRELQRSLSRSFGGSTARFLTEAVRARDWRGIEKRKAYLRLRLIVRVALHSPVKLLAGCLGFVAGHLRARLIGKSGMFLVLLGPDGAGKSTVAEKLGEALRPVFKHRRYYHGRFGTVPRLRTFVRRLAHHVRPEAEPAQTSAEPGRAVSVQLGLPRILAHVVYYGLDYLLGHWIVRRSAAYGDLIIFDRYFYDWFIQSSFQCMPRVLLPILTFLYPKPDLIVHLCNRPDVIHRRKPELTITQIEEQNEQCRRIVAVRRGGMTVATDVPVEEVVRAIAERVQEIMAARCRSEGR